MLITFSFLGMILLSLPLRCPIFFFKAYFSLGGPSDEFRSCCSLKLKFCSLYLLFWLFLVELHWNLFKKIFFCWFWEPKWVPVFMAGGTSLTCFFSVLGAKFSSPASNGGDSWGGIAIFKALALVSLAMSWALLLDSRHLFFIFWFCEIICSNLDSIYFIFIWLELW